jgi:MYXO-CTERM domain-containing protein
MKVNVLPIVAGFAGSLILSAGASAALVGLKLENKSSTYLSGDFGTVDASGFNQYNAVVFELYANFDNANDNLLNIFGSEINASHNFHHIDEGDGPTSLPFKKSVYDAFGQVDSYVTIGFSYGTGAPNPDGPDGGTTADALKVSVDPSFNEDGFWFGNSIDDPAQDPSKGAGWFSTDAGANNIQGKAGTYGDLKVLIARFAFTGSQGDLVSIIGKLKLTYKNGAVTTQTGFLEFAGEREILAVPAPGAIALLGLAGLAGRRRRSA